MFTLKSLKFKCLDVCNEIRIKKYFSLSEESRQPRVFHKGRSHKMVELCKYSRMVFLYRNN